MLAPSTAATWVGAVATSAAVFIALFKDEWLKYRRRPRLSVSIDPKPPDCLLIPSLVYGPNRGVLWRGDIYYLRLWVENGGRGRAEQVQVFLSKLYKKNANHEFAPVSTFVPMNLRWSNYADSRPEIFAAGISQKFGKHCDLCSISDPANPTEPLKGYEGQPIGNLQVEAPPNNDSHRLPPGDYKLEVMVGAANANPITRSVLLNLKGKWSSDPDTMFRDYVGVRLA
jgi:hypothetical protein